MKEKWPRWIFASCTTFFDAQRQGLVMYIEGQDNRVNETEQDYIEFRMDGPVINQRTRNNYKLTIDLNVLIITYISQRDLHKIYRHTGIVVEMFKTVIPVRRFGDGNTLIGCLNLESEITVAHFGQIQPESRMLQATVEASYGITLRE